MLGNTNSTLPMCLTFYTWTRTVLYITIFQIITTKLIDNYFPREDILPYFTKIYNYVFKKYQNSFYKTKISLFSQKNKLIFYFYIFFFITSAKVITPLIIFSLVALEKLIRIAFLGSPAA